MTQDISIDFQTFQTDIQKGKWKTSLFDQSQRVVLENIFGVDSLPSIKMSTPLKCQHNKMTRLTLSLGKHAYFNFHFVSVKSIFHERRKVLNVFLGGYHI